MSKQFDPKKPVQTRDGRKARIICTDLKDPKYSILALIDNSGQETASTYTSNGVSCAPQVWPEHDLINMPEEKVFYGAVMEGNIKTLAPVVFHPVRPQATPFVVGVLKLVFTDDKLVSVSIMDEED